MEQILNLRSILGHLQIPQVRIIWDSFFIKFFLAISRFLFFNIADTTGPPCVDRSLSTSDEPAPPSPTPNPTIRRTLSFDSRQVDPCLEFLLYLICSFFFFRKIIFWKLTRKKKNLFQAYFWVFFIYSMNKRRNILNIFIQSYQQFLSCLWNPNRVSGCSKTRKIVNVFTFRFIWSKTVGTDVKSCYLWSVW